MKAEGGTLQVSLTEGARHPIRWSVRARVTVVAVSVAVVLLVLVVAGLFVALRQSVHSGLEERGDAAVSRAAAHLRAGAAPESLPVEVPGFYLVQAVDGRGRVVASSEAIRGRPPMISIRPPAGSGPVDRTVDLPGVADRVHVTAVAVTSPRGPMTVYAAAPDVEIAGTKTLFIGGLLGMTIVLACLVGLIIWRSVGRALRPFQAMREELAAVTAGRLDRRISVPDTCDEVAGLAQEVNGTLRRLERFVNGQRTFVADASHELRSPLTALRAQLEVALAHPEDEDWPAVARTALDDADRLQHIIADLLLLARLDARVEADLEPLDLGELARTEIERHPRKVPVHTAVVGGAVILGDRNRLSRLLTNLLDNAERHARAQVWVTVVVEGGHAVLEVADDGSGIPPEERRRVFDRFQRLAESRARDSGGSGLGLPIAAEIAAGHRGALYVADPESGEEFTSPAVIAGCRGARLILRLPLAMPPTAARDQGVVAGGAR